MALMIRAFIAALVLVLLHSVRANDLNVRKDGVARGPNDFVLNFVHDWKSRNILYILSPLQLRCYAILYYTKNPTKIEIGTIDLEYKDRKPIAFGLRRRNLKHGWRIQCDYWYRAASLQALKQGIVLVGGAKRAAKCLKRNGGCDIVFTYGEARRYSRLGGWEFLGELTESLCFLRSFVFCYDRNYPRHMFGNYCDDICDFKCQRHCAPT